MKHQKIEFYRHPAGGWGALKSVAHQLLSQGIAAKGAKTMLSANQPDGHRMRECTQIILGEIDRLNSLMAQLLDLTGPPRLERRGVNIHEIIDRVIAIEGAGRGGNGSGAGVNAGLAGPTTTGRLPIICFFSPGWGSNGDVGVVCPVGPAGGVGVTVGVATGLGAVCGEAAIVGDALAARFCPG